MKKALLLVDIQNDFMPGGSLAVEGGDEIIPVVNQLIHYGEYDLIIASQDWHPKDHGSFASQHNAEPFAMGKLSGKPQIMWPDHCIQGSLGAEFHPDLKQGKINYIQQKGTDKNIDSYSAFRDNDKKCPTGLDLYLKKQNITKLHICGLATDFCVKFTAIDAKEMLPEIEITFIEDASKAISAAGNALAKTQMQEKAVIISLSTHILSTS